MARLASPGLNPWFRGHKSHSFDKWLHGHHLGDSDYLKKLHFKKMFCSLRILYFRFTQRFTHKQFFFQYKRIANERKVTELSKHKPDSINFYFETVNRFQIVLLKFCWTRQQIAFHIKLLISSLTPVSYKHAIYGKLLMHADTYSYVLCFTENQY